MQVSKAQIFNEKWGTDYETPESKRGMWDGWSQSDLQVERSKLKSSGPHDSGSAGATRLRQVNFALRAKHHWGKAGK